MACFLIKIILKSYFYFWIKIGCYEECCPCQNNATTMLQASSESTAPGTFV